MIQPEKWAELISACSAQGIQVNQTLVGDGVGVIFTQAGSTFSVAESFVTLFQGTMEGLVETVAEGIAFGRSFIPGGK